MLLHHDTSSKSAHLAALGDKFTSAELERLVTLRRDFTEHAEHSEFMTEPAQLEFARWLFENGRIGEYGVKRSAKRS